MEESDRQSDLLTLLQKCGDRSAFRLVAPSMHGYASLFKSPGKYSEHKLDILFLGFNP